MTQQINAQNIVDRLTSIEPRTTCCHRCHFEYEEKYLFPHISKADQDMLKKEHIWLLEKKFPREEMAIHIEKEEEIFLACDQIENILLERMIADHVKYEMDLEKGD